MTELTKLELGALPWEPKRGLRMRSEFDRWDVPTAGLLRSWRGRYYLFRCLDGAASQYSVWAYAAISKKQAQHLQKLTGKELRDVQFEIFLAQDLSFAIAEEDAGIIHRFSGRMEKSDPQPRIQPEVARKVQSEIQEEARAVQDMAVFAM
jgi:hypothetical protein